MIETMLNWIDENEDAIVGVFAFGVAIGMAIVLISLRFIL